MRVTSKEVVAMRALVVYESMYGNTHAVAEAIAAGLGEAYEVSVIPVGEATSELVAAADLLVAGGPTHMHRMSSAASRRMAGTAAVKDGSGVAMDPGADGPGLRDWLDGIGPGHRLAAAFDTRFNGVPALTGQASHGISRLLRKRGYRLVAAPESFLVDKQNTLRDGESSRARRWGATLAGVAPQAGRDT
jgi:Flavodoxin domain